MPKPRRSQLLHGVQELQIGGTRRIGATETDAELRLLHRRPDLLQPPPDAGAALGDRFLGAVEFEQSDRVEAGS